MEIKKETQAKKKEKQVKPGVVYADVVKSQSNTFKIFSRAICNFGFPEGMDRPYPSDFREALSQMTGEKAGKKTEAGEEEEEPEDADEAEEKKEEAEKPTTYVLAVAEALAKFKAPESAHMFSKEALPKMSPKFQAIFDRLLESPGPALLYSNFRTVEGIGLLSIAMEQQLNYVKMDLVKTASGWSLSPETLAKPGPQKRYVLYTGSEDKEKRSVLLKIFNGAWSKLPASLVEQIQTLAGSETNLHGEIVKAILITVTGAEGISLSNVRQVHILEPHWNYVRLEQVKGRAVRICSHMDLPPEERKVDIFTYITKFGEGQKIDETLKNKDHGLTTDEQIINLLIAKKQLADAMMNAMKSSAVDCELNETENGGIVCYKQPLRTESFDPDLYRHLEQAAGIVRATREEK